MRIQTIQLAAVLWLLGFNSLQATVFYVDVNSTNPTPPYADWSTAATDIQSAVDAASDGDLIWVNDGVYQTGGRVVYGALTNRVVINKAVTVQSVNGATATVIRGNRAQGNNAVRCAYLTNNATLNGFTLIGGATRLTGDTFKEQSAGGAYCESINAAIIGCLIVSNVASLYGGGECFGMLSNCSIVGNWSSNNYNAATFGGGVAFGTVNNSLVQSNSASMRSSNTSGGGAYSNLLNNCSVMGNSVVGKNAYGAGVELCTLNNCVVSNNVISTPAGLGYGGGADASILNFCLVSSNYSSLYGGGAYASKLNGCLIIWNTAATSGGGAFTSTLLGHKSYLACFVVECFGSFEFAMRQPLERSSGVCSRHLDAAGMCGAVRGSDVWICQLLLSYEDFVA